MTAFLNLGSLALGLGAVVFAIFACKSGKLLAAQRRSVISLVLCSLALLFQLFEIAHRISLNDLSAVADTIRAVILAGTGLTLTVLVLIALALKKRSRK